MSTATTESMLVTTGAVGNNGARHATVGAGCDRFGDGDDGGDGGDACAGAGCEAALDRVALLVPNVAHAARHDPVEYALAYVEQYTGDVVQVEREWDFLRSTLELAWHRERHAAALRIAHALAHAAGRRGRFADGEHVVRLGIESARQIGDRRSLGLLVNRLGSLRFAHGHYWQGWRLWRAGLELDSAAMGRGWQPRWWAPRVSFAVSVDILARFGADQWIMELLAGEGECEDAETLAVALFVRGFQAHRRGNRDRAYDDITAALRLSTREAGTGPTEAWHVLLLTMQIELARLHGDERRVRECADAAIALARVAGDRFTAAALITDQALYAYYQGRLDECRALLRSLDDGAPGVEPLPIVLRGHRFLEQYLAEPTSDGPTPGTASSALIRALPSAAARAIRLSAREAEVLQLVAAGHSTRAIASRLVVTPATVKKHLEHVYTRLDAHSRTAAVATARTLGLLS